MSLKNAWVTVLVLGASGVHAAHPLITEDAETVGAGHAQLELNMEHGLDREEGVETRTRQFGALLALGAADSVDVVMGQPYLRVRTRADGIESTAQGVGDFSLDLKWRFHRSTGRSFALKVGGTAPTGDAATNLGTGRSTFSAFVFGSFERGPWALHLHTGYKANRNRLGEPVDVVHFSAATAYQASRIVKLVADVALDTDFQSSTSSQPAWLVLGAICSLGNAVDLDLGWRRGLNGVAPDDVFLLGVTTRW